ncbi:MAG: hypothetical protein E6J86_13280 [Deltaproteobacteria bacterium]|nr:MAG: hypothetical protein E6J86_13280 [Deltaproteobacteria bacterium]
MKATLRAVLATSLLLAPAAFATKVPIPIEGATLNVSVQVQTEALIMENGAPNGTDASYDVFVRRTRLLANGDISQNFSYLLQIDNANFGKFGNFGGRAIVQDAWIGWAPTGITGGNVLYIDAGLLLIPISHHLLESTTNFITADVHTDEFRFPANPFQGLRDTGIQLRGWWLDKKIGFRGGVYEGYAPIATAGTASTTTPPSVCVPPGTAPPAPPAVAAPTCITPKRYPQFAGFVNFDIIGSEEGGWLYGAYKWGKDPIVSVGVSGIYQADAVKNSLGNPANLRIASADVYINFPQTEAAELVIEATGYLNGNGSGSSSTGKGFFVDAGYRFEFVAPYASFSYFDTDDCSGLTLTAGQRTTCNTAVDVGNSRNFKAGLNFFFNKNLNHLNLEFQSNHGVSSFGAQSITATNAGYVPRGITNSLRVSAQKSFLAHWNVLF